LVILAMMDFPYGGSEQFKAHERSRARHSV
jgi:hypothetical protein